MSDPLSETALREAICALTRAKKTQQGFEVSLPQVYHTGQAVEVVVATHGDGFLVHDNSYAAMLLSSHGLKIGKKLAEALAPQIAAYGCEMDEFRVRRACSSPSQLGFAMSTVGCASRLVADQLLKVDQAPVRDFKSSVISRVTETVGTERIRTNEEVNGHLGSRYRVSITVLDARQARPLAFVEPVADRDAIPRRFKQFYDLARTEQYLSVQRVAVYDDEQAMAQGDALLMQEVGNFVRYKDAPVRFNEWATIQ
ncbi:MULTISPECIES: hypothetical protein [Alphaproteobacteria]|uniref:hypothetical protein n=1 Tax=Alphaproteobacteria TaxID=28211 RepID=UPI0022DF8651|nr:hypothetical protein [Marinicauda sp. Alg238-R41]